uniref:Peptidoglycan-associated lipoprotein n=1 Tax=Geobacter sp. (strain M21) TaxID=443144 RepID=C6E652_GEOSM
MRKMILGSLVVLTFGALLSAGCAKKDVVRTEEPISAAQSAPTQAPATQARPEADSGAAQQPITETTPSREQAVTQETAKEAGTGATQEVQAELQKVYFNFDAADLSEEARGSLSKNAEYLSRQAGIKVRIEGNCDERGSDDYNMALGERRAKAARDYLVNLGIASDRLSTISYGEEKPADPGHDEAAWAKNRRAEFVIVK